MDFSQFNHLLVTNKLILSSIIPNFDESRFTFASEKHIDKRIKNEEKQIAEFSPVLDTAVYSYIGSFLYARGCKTLVKHILKLIEDEKQLGLVLVCALTQLALDDKSEPVVGQWFDPCSCALFPSDSLTSNTIRSQCEECLVELGSNLLPRGCENVLEFNAINGTKLLVAEIVLLMCVSNYTTQALSDCIIETEWNFTMNDIPLHRYFVPNFGDSDKLLKWRSPKSAFVMEPFCIDHYKKDNKQDKDRDDKEDKEDKDKDKDKEEEEENGDDDDDDVTVCDVTYRGKTHILVRLTTAQMKKDWVVTSYLNMVIRIMVIDRYKYFSESINKTYRIKSQLVCLKNEVTGKKEYCVALSNWTDNLIPDLCDIEEMDVLENASYNGYGFISATLAVYLRMMANIDDRNINLHVPIENGVFFAYTDFEPFHYHASLLFFSYGLPFLSSSFIPRNKQKTSSDIEQRVRDIPQMLTNFVIDNGWVDVGTFTGNYDTDSMFMLFSPLPDILNNKNLINSGSVFISKIFKLPLYEGEFVKFNRCMDDCNKIFDDTMKGAGRFQPVTDWVKTYAQG